MYTFYRQNSSFPYVSKRLKLLLMVVKSTVFVLQQIILFLRDFVGTCTYAAENLMQLQNISGLLNV